MFNPFTSIVGCHVDLIFDGRFSYLALLLVLTPSTWSRFTVVNRRFIYGINILGHGVLEH